MNSCTSALGRFSISLYWILDQWKPLIGGSAFQGGSPKVINNSSSENSFNSVVIFSLSTELTNIPASVISWCGLIWRTESRGDEVKSGESVTKRATGGGVVEIWLIKYRERKVRDAENGWAVTCKPHQLWQNQCRCGRPEGAAMLIMKHTGEECVFLYTHTHTHTRMTQTCSVSTPAHMWTHQTSSCALVWWNRTVRAD